MSNFSDNLSLKNIRKHQELSYNYGYDQYARMLCSTHHNSFGITGLRLKRTAASGASLNVQVKISGESSSGNFKSSIMEKWNTCAKLTPAVDTTSASFPVTQQLEFPSSAEYADASGYVAHNGDHYFYANIHEC